MDPIENFTLTIQVQRQEHGIVNIDWTTTSGPFFERRNDLINLLSDHFDNHVQIAAQFIVNAEMESNLFDDDLIIIPGLSLIFFVVVIPSPL